MYPLPEKQEKRSEELVGKKKESNGGGAKKIWITMEKQKKC